MKLYFERLNWKYRVTDEFFYPMDMPIDTPVNVNNWMILSPHGLTADCGYAWDGPSGPTIDTADSMRASLVHDMLYQLIRMGHLTRKCRRRADREFRRILKADGMNFVRRWAWYFSVRLFGGRYI